MSDGESVHEKIDRLEAKINLLEKSVSDLVTAWSTAKGLTAFMKWLATVATAAVVLYNVWHTGSPK